MNTTETNVVDPICGMTIDPADAAGRSAYGGTDYFFCAKSCKAAFDADPAKYAAPSAAHSCCSSH